MTQSNYYLGIDGGGSKTDAVIIDDEERVLGAGLSAGSNVTFTTHESAVHSYVSAITDALTAASLEPQSITAAGCTFASAARTAFDQVGIGVAPKALPEPAVAFERAGVQDRVGVVLIAGTGSSCVGYGRNSVPSYVGGWGAVLGDDGSAYFIGRTAIRRVLSAADGRTPPTSLTEKALDYFSIQRPREIIRVFAGTCVNQTLAAGFAARVSEAANEGDQAAVDILAEAGAELSQMALFVAGRTFAADEEFSLVLAGGVFGAGKVLVEQITRPFAEKYPNCSVLMASMRPGEAAARVVRREYVGRI